MYSFYGGRPGNSFVIVTTYLSIDEMVTAFKQGPDYTAVHYNEYVLINTPNKNNNDNGKIFRRGYNYQNDMGGAEQIGQIAGPAGPAPNLKIGDFNYLQTEKANNDSSLISDETNIKQWGDGSGLVPGKTSNGQYNDTIKWKSFLVKTANSAETTAYIGFEIPYPIIEFTAGKTETPYDSPIIEPVLIDDNNDGQTENHPFYKKWNIKIPQGIKGDNLADLKIKYRYQSNGNIYYADENDEQNTRQPWICYKLKTFINNANGQDINEWNPVCPYVVVSKVYQTEDGAIHISYTDGTDVVNDAAEKMKWVQTMSVDSTGLIRIHFTDGSSSALKYKTTSEDDEGIETETEYVRIKWLTDMRVGASGGIQVKWSDGNDFVDLLRDNGDQVSLDVITNIELNKNGKLIATYNSVIGYRDTSKEEDGNNFIPFNELSTYLNERITLPEGMSRQEYQQMYIIEVYKTSILNENTALKWIDNISQQGNQLTVTYNIQKEGSISEDDDLYQTQTLYLKYPANFSLEENGNLNMQWADQRGEGGEIKTLGSINSILNTAIDANGNLLFRFSNDIGKTKISYGDYNDWTYIGTVTPGAFGFQGNQTVIRNKIISGFLKEKDLYFSLQTSLLFPSSTEDAYVLGGEPISFKAKDNSIEGAFSFQQDIQGNYNYVIAPNLCGLDFILNNAVSDSVGENPIPVDIYIESFELGFTFKQGQQEATGGDILSRLQKIQTSLYQNDQSSDQGSIDKLAQAISDLEEAEETMRLLQNQINSISQRINSQIDPQIFGTTSPLSIAADYIDGNGQGKMFQSNYGGTNILNSLQYLRKPPMRILIPIDKNGNEIIKLDGGDEDVEKKITKGYYMHTPGWTSSTGEWNETQDTQQLFLDGNNYINNQQHGYILRWNRYLPNNAQYTRVQKSSYIYYFLPKGVVTTGWRPFSIPLFTMMEHWGMKYLYVKNEKKTDGTYQTRIHGHFNNNQSITINDIPFDNNYWVLTAIYGM